MTHRAATLVILISLSVLLLSFMLAGGIASWNAQSLAALLVAVAVALAGALAFSWRRYFGRRQP